MRALGLDIGATAIKAAIVDRQGRVRARAEVATRGEDGSAAVLERACGLVMQLARDDSQGRAIARPITAVGVGSCGLVDSRGRVLETTDTMPGWDGTDIPVEVERRTGLSCTADNDGNAAALGEALCGVGRGRQSLAMLTLGTGVGGGVVTAGRIVHGAGSMAGTFGHLCVMPGGRECACGANGCLEAYASAWAMRRYAGCDARELFSRASRGDARAAEHIDLAARALGIALSLIAHAINPEVIAIGGGMATSWPALENAVLQHFRAHTLAPALASTRVAPASLGTDAGIVGAAMLAFAPAPSS